MEPGLAPTGQPMGSSAEGGAARAYALWRAPVVSGPVEGVVSVPGSKSETNRALVLAALATSASRISRGLRARDTLLMAAALRSLGVRVDDVPASIPRIRSSAADQPANARQELDWLVTPAALHGPASVDCGLAGTVMRFLPAVAGLAEGEVGFDGDAAARLRPMSQLIGALRHLGVQVDDGGRGTVPFTVLGMGRVRGGRVDVDASASSQFVSALLLAGSRYDAGVRIRHVGPNSVPSTPHIKMTVEMLRQRGVDVVAESDEWTVSPGSINGFDDVIEPDLSNAGPFLAAALVTGGRVVVRDWPNATTQPGEALVGLFERMGATTELTADGLVLQGPDRLLGIDADLHDVGELTPIIAACAVLAGTPSLLRGIAHLRGHESDRLAALATELHALGANVNETPDGLSIEPMPLHGGLFRTYEDHRMATAAAVIGLRIPGIEVENIGTTAKTLPDFERTWDALIVGSGGRVPV